MRLRIGTVGACSKHISRTLSQSANGKLTMQASKLKFQEARLKLKKLRLGQQREADVETRTALCLFITKLHNAQNTCNPFKRLLRIQRQFALGM